MHLWEVSLWRIFTKLLVCTHPAACLKRWWTQSQQCIAGCCISCKYGSQQICIVECYLHWCHHQMSIAKHNPWLHRLMSLFVHRLHSWCIQVLPAMIAASWTMQGSYTCCKTNKECCSSQKQNVLRLSIYYSGGESSPYGESMASKIHAIHQAA